MKNKYQRMSKEDKKEIKNKYYQTEAGKIMKNRLTRLLITGSLGIIFSLYLVYDYYTKSNNVWECVTAILLVIASLAFLIGQYKIRGKVLNKFAISNSKK